MRCGVPVVATAVNAVPEVVIPGRTGLLVGPRDLRGLARAIDSLLRNPREATRLAAAAREHIDGRFTPEALGADLAETYDDMEHDLAARVSPVRRRGIGVVPAAVRSLT
jgi:glycosyltransferase involved in cell wall biosynthesis